MIKKLFIFILLFIAANSNAQLILGANPSYHIPFGKEAGMGFGAQILIEKPSNERNSYFGKISYFFPRKSVTKDAFVADAIDPNTQPSSLNLSIFTNYSTFSVEFGRRTYWINPIDYGFSIYGGTTMMISFSNVKNRLDSYNKNLYQLFGQDGTSSDNNINGKGNIFSLGISLSGGMKYDINHFGTVFLDLNFGYNFLQLATNSIASQGYQNLGSSLNFYFGLGYRKILFFNNAGRRNGNQPQQRGY